MRPEADLLCSSVSLWHRGTDSALVSHTYRLRTKATWLPLSSWSKPRAAACRHNTHTSALRRYWPFTSYNRDGGGAVDRRVFYKVSNFNGISYTNDADGAGSRDG